MYAVKMYAVGCVNQKYLLRILRFIEKIEYDFNCDIQQMTITGDNIDRVDLMEIKFWELNWRIYVAEYGKEKRIRMNKIEPHIESVNSDDDQDMDIDIEFGEDEPEEMVSDQDGGGEIIVYIDDRFFLPVLYNESMNI